MLLLLATFSVATLLFVLLLWLRFRLIILIIVFAIHASTVHVHEVAGILSEVQVILECLPHVEIIEVHSDLHRLVKSVHQLLSLLVLIVLVLATFGGLAGLEAVVERFGGDSFDNLTGLASLLVLLLFLDFFGSKIFAILPVDWGSKSLDNLLLRIILELDLKTELLIGEVVILFECQLNGGGRWVRTL